MLENPGNQREAANDRVAQPVRPTVSIPPPTLTTSLRTGEDAEFQRRILRQDHSGVALLPEDYAAGTLLVLASNERPRGELAISLLRSYFTALAKDQKTDSFCTSSADRFSHTMFDPLTKEIAELKTVRFLSNHHIDPLEAGFDVRLITATSNARLQIYLDWNNSQKKWLISDIQGNASTLSQAAETGYNDYEPTEVERQLIREGHIK